MSLPMIIAALAALSLVAADSRGEEPSEKTVRVGAISVRVVDPAGGVVGDAQVNLGDRRLTEAGEDGFYRFQNVKPGRSSISVRVKGYRPAWARADVAAGETTEVIVPLDAGASVAGVVVNGVGKPVAGATVTVEPVDGEDPDPSGWREITSYTTNTDSQGRFRLTGLPPRAATVDAHRGQVGRVGRICLCAKVRVQLPQQDLRLVLRPSSSVIIKLVTPDGKPFTEPSFNGVKTTIWRRGEFTAIASVYTASDDGVFVFDDLKEGTYEFEIQTDAFVPIVRRFISRPQTRLDLGTAVLDPGLPVRGRVTGPGGAPLKNVWVLATAVPSNESSRDLWLPATAHDGLLNGNYTYTGEDGTFVLDHVPAGRVFLEAWDEGFACAPTEVEVKPDLGAVTIHLTEGAKVWCVLRKKDGTPVADDRIMAVRWGKDGKPALAPRRELRATDSDGKAGFRLTTGHWRIYRRTFAKGRAPGEFLLGEWVFEEGKTYNIDLALP